MLPFIPRHGFHFDPTLGGTVTLYATRAVEEFDPDAPKPDELPAPLWLRVVTGSRLRATRADCLAPGGVAQPNFNPHRCIVLLYEPCVLADKAA
jgi:hypothetical protein